MLGILLIIAIIVWLGLLEQRRVDAAINQLAADLRLAHTSATNQLTDWRVVIPVPGNSPVVDGCPADYCMVKLTTPYDGGPAALAPIVSQVVPRDLPEGTKVYFASPPASPRTTVPADPANIQTVLPSAAGNTRTIEFSSDGTSRALSSPAGTVVVSSTDDAPRRKLTFQSATARIKVFP